MPLQYEKIRNSYISRGDDEKDAKRKAAMTFIAKGKGGSRHSRAVALHDKPTVKKRPVKFGKPE